MTTLCFREGAWATLREAVERAYPEEACGVCVVGDNSLDVVIAVRPLANVHAEPRRAFAFDDKEHLALLRELASRGESVRAFFHSHPDGEASLSPRDLDAALFEGAPLWPGVDWIVLTTRGPRVHEARRFALGSGVPREGPLALPG